MGANITNYSGYRINDTEGRVELNGTGFGADPGKVQLVQTGKHVGANETILSWTDTQIVMATPASVSYRHVVVVPGSGSAAVLTNLNPQLSTSLLKGIIWISASSPDVGEILLVGTGLTDIDHIIIGLNHGSPMYYDPEGPNAALTPDGIEIVEWSDSLLDIIDTREGVGLTGKTALALLSWNVSNAVNSEFDFDNFDIA